MKQSILTTFVILSACGLLGCGPNVGWVVRPLPLEQTLTETTLKTDPGLFVPDKILLLDVDGLLFNRAKEGLLSTGENPVGIWVEKLDKAQADANIKAVVVRINSPGGGVTASDVMYQRLREFRRQRNVPVIAVIEDVGASGGYYLACAADTILAHPTSVTGSIGTMVQTVSFAGTMSLLRIEAKAVTSGRRKDMASPLKPLDKEDLAILQKMVDEYHQRLLDVVGASREALIAEQVAALADGRVFTGAQAKDNGLVDETGTVWEAVALAKRRSGSRRVRVVMYHRPLGYRANVYSAAPNAPASPQINFIHLSAPRLLSSLQPQFWYLWTGHTYR